MILLETKSFSTKDSEDGEPVNVDASAIVWGPPTFWSKPEWNGTFERSQVSNSRMISTMVSSS